MKRPIIGAAVGVVLAIAPIDSRGTYTAPMTY